MTRFMIQEHQQNRRIFKILVSHKGELLKSECKSMVDMELESKIKKFSVYEDQFEEMTQLSEYEKALNDHVRQIKKHAGPIVLQYESMMKRLLSSTRNLQLFTKIITHHDTLLLPNFAVSFMEDKLECPIKIVNEKNVQLHHSKREGREPLVVTYTTETESFVVNDEVFTPEEYGNNYLLFAMMSGAPNLPYELRKEIVDACKHKCLSFGSAEHIENLGMSHCIDFRLVGAGKLYFTQDVYKFAIVFGREVQKLQKASTISEQEFMSEEKLSKLGLRIVHIFPIDYIENIILYALKNKYEVLLKLFLVLMPTLEEVDKEKSVFGKKKEKQAFLKVYRDHEIIYGKRVRKAKKIIKEEWIHSDKKQKMSQTNFETLVSILNCAPANVYLYSECESDKSHYKKIKKRILKIRDYFLHHKWTITYLQNPDEVLNQHERHQQIKLPSSESMSDTGLPPNEMPLKQGKPTSSSLQLLRNDAEVMATTKSKEPDKCDMSPVLPPGGVSARIRLFQSHISQNEQIKRATEPSQIKPSTYKTKPSKQKPVLHED